MTRISLNPDTLAVEGFATGAPATEASTTLVGNRPPCGPSAFDSRQTQC